MADGEDRSLFSLGEEVLELHLQQFHNHLKPMHLVPYLVPFLDKAALPKIRRADKNSSAEAVDILFEELQKKNEPGWFAGFRDALEQAEFEYLRRLLAGTCEVPEKTQRFYKFLINAVLPELKELTPGFLYDHLLQRGLITKRDFEEIRKHEQNYGEQGAALLLITEHLDYRKEDWFPGFIGALNSSGHRHISRCIDPLFEHAYTDEQIAHIANGIITLNTGEMSDEEYAKWKKSAAMEEDKALGSQQEEVREHRVSVHEKPTPSQRVLAPNIPDTAAAADRQGGKEEEEDDDDITLLKQRAQTNDQQQPNTDDMSEIQKEIEELQQRLLQLKLQQQKLDAAANETTLKKQQQLGDEDNMVNDVHLGANSLSMKVCAVAPVAQEKILNVDNMAYTQQQQADQSVRPREPSTPVVPLPAPKELKLRDYQLELAQDALQGKNTVIVAPTGSGKTHVALWISKAHFEARVHSISAVPKKVAFVVPTVALVSQQLAQYQQYLPALRCCGLHGDNKASTPNLSLLLDQYQVFVLTPMILVDAAKEIQDKDLMVSFTLMFLDECHHTTKEHPYKQLMDIYFENRPTLRPQIVGMTASVGVGKNMNMEGAVNHVMKLCSQLDAEVLRTVTDNIHNLNQHSSQPQQDKHEVHGRTEDPFHEQVKEIMQHIQDFMKTRPGIREVPESEVKNLPGLLEAPCEVGDAAYTQWVSALRKNIPKIFDQKIRMLLTPCYQQLKFYNEALILNADCRSKDALDYIEKERALKVMQSDDTRSWLDTIYKEKLDLLRRVSNDPRYENPKLLALKDVMRKKILYKMDVSDSRTIVFCQTRALTTALVDWMKEDNELKELRPHSLTGSNAKGAVGGMTAFQQVDALKLFRDGEYRVIVATTVAEEGLDVRKCNLVIRYEHVTNETAMIQARGRGRAEDAEYLLITEKGRGAAEKEDVNRCKEELMKKSLDYITSLTAREFRERIQKEQQLALLERQRIEMEQQLKARSVSSKPTDGWLLHCIECDSMGIAIDDVKKIKNQHHAAMDRDIVDRAIVVKKTGNNATPQCFDDITFLGSKVKCAKCRHDWGVLVSYRSVRLALLAVDNFVLVDEHDRRSTCKKWKDTPFSVLPLDDEAIPTCNFEWRGEQAPVSA